MKVRIVPYKPMASLNSTFWKVQVKSVLLRIKSFKVYRWRTVGDYSSYTSANVVAETIVKNEKEFGEETK